MTHVSKQGRPIIAVVGGIVGLAVVVVLVWVAATFLPLLLHGSTGTPAPPTHWTGAGGGASGTTLAYAVADVEGNSQKDRDQIGGKTISVSGYVVGATAGGQIIADQALSTASSPELVVEPAQPSLHKGDKARFTGLYNSAQNVLNVTGTDRSQ